MAFSGLDIFGTETHSNRTGIPSLQRFNNLSFLLLIFSGCCLGFIKGIPRLRLPYLFVLVYILTMLMSFYQTDNQIKSLSGLMVCTRGPLLYLLCSYILPNDRNIKKISNAFIALGIISSIVAILQELNFLIFRTNSFIDPILVTLGGFRFLRAQSFMSNPNMLGFCLGVSFLILLGNFRNLFKKPWIGYFFMILMASALIFTFSLTAYLSVLTVFLIFILTKHWKLFSRKMSIKKEHFIAWAGFALLCVGVFFYIRYYITQSSFFSRKYLLVESLELLIRNPFLGLGIGNVAPYTSEVVNPHNQFLEVATSCGIIGLIPLLFFLYWMYREISFVEKIDSTLGQTLKNCFIFMLVTFMFDGYMSNMVPWMVYSLIDLAYRTKKLEMKRGEMGVIKGNGSS